MIVTAGGAHALYVAFQAILDPGDDMMLFAPYWTPIRDMITMAQARPVMIPTSSARRNGITATLEHLSTPHTRAIYYNTPQNPSGLVFSRQEAEEVAAFAIKHNLVVVADEAYEDLVYEGEHVSIASLPGMAERTITCYTFSKTYAMTGWRIGYAVAKEPFMTGITQAGALLHERRFHTHAVGGARGSGGSAERHRGAARGISAAARSAGCGAERAGTGMRPARGRLLCVPAGSPKSTKTAAGWLPCSLKKSMSPRFPGLSSAPREKGMCASATLSRLRRFAPDSTLCGNFSRRDAIFGLSRFVTLISRADRRRR